MDRSDFEVHYISLYTVSCFCTLSNFYCLLVQGTCSAWEHYGYKVPRSRIYHAGTGSTERAERCLLLAICLTYEIRDLQYQVARLLQARWGRRGKQQQKQNSPNLGTTILPAPVCYSLPDTCYLVKPSHRPHEELSWTKTNHKSKVARSLRMIKHCR